jgi:hypothetical protein
MTRIGRILADKPNRSGGKTGFFIPQKIRVNPLDPRHPRSIAFD